MVRQVRAPVAQLRAVPKDRRVAVQWAKLIGSLVLLTIGGVALIVFAWLWLRVGRRVSQREDALIQRRGAGPRDDDWTRKAAPRRSFCGERSRWMTANLWVRPDKGSLLNARRTDWRTGGARSKTPGAVGSLVRG